MRRAMRVLGLCLIIVGILGLAWAVTVWRWQDPFTGLYTRWEQHRLAQQYDGLMRAWRPQADVTMAPPSIVDWQRSLARAATAFGHETHRGEAIGRIVIGRIGLNMVLVNGTDSESLKRGPGRDLRSYMPGQHRLVYIAGHRTTYLAPFSHIDDLRTGDYIKIEVPYGTFTYRTIGHEIVAATDMAMLKSPSHELLRLQACHPRFFATHRYIVDARLVSVQVRNGRSYAVPEEP